MSKQQLLFYPMPLNHYDALFDHLDLSPIKELTSATGRKPFSRQAICRTLIYGNLQGIRTLSELESELSTNSAIAYKCGFDNPPSRHRFEEFLHSTPNEILQRVRRKQVKILISLGVITGKFLSIDSTPVIAWVRENNPKIFLKGKFNKRKFPKGDPDARLGVMLGQKSPSVKKEPQLELFKSSKFKKQIQFFWGYRNHTIFDSLSELPVFEITKQANVAECKMFIPSFKQLKKDFKFKPKGVLGDASHDAEYIRKFIRKNLKSKDFIPFNPRASKQEIKLTPHNTRICIAGFEMYPWGKFKDRGRIRQKFVCPILHLKHMAKKYSTCPMHHPAFSKGGCYAYTRVDKSYRASAPNPKSEHFKEVYKLQSGS